LSPGGKDFAIDWKSLFTEIRVDWKDRGPNTSKGNTNIRCPFCGPADRGFHLAVSNEIEAYHCYRNPGNHSGRRFSSLLYQLGVPRTEAIRLLNKHRQDVVAADRVPEPVAPAGGTWNSFQTAAASDTYLDYLHKRGFDHPAHTATRYELKYAPGGRWAQRLLIPVYDGEQLLTWIGRAIRKDLEPRYYNRPCNDDSYVYLPRAPRRVMFLTEGPIDALKVAVALDRYDAGAVALCSKNLNASRIARLHAMQCSKIYVMLDSDASLLNSFAMHKELARACPSLYIGRTRPPAPYKDAGEMSEQAIKEAWSGAC
jgi:hypothetical protein